MNGASRFARVLASTSRSVILTGIATIALAGCATTPSQQMQQQQQHQQEQQYEQLTRAVDLLSQGRAKEAADLHLTQLAEDCTKQYADSDQRLYAARSPAESILYMVMAAADDRNAAVIDTPCAEAHYLLGFALIELGDIDEAERQLNRAIEWTPHHSQYLSELGHLHHIRKDWNAALETFELAEEGSSLSPDDVKDDHRARALRGVGYSLIELGDLDQAEQKFQECLKINPKDDMALNELSYIQSLRNQQLQEST